MMMPFSLLVVIVSFVYADAVLLGDIQALTLHKGRQTTGRRSPPMPQLVCVGGSAQHRANEVTIVQCYNKGFDGHSYAWECVSELDKSLKLGQVTVTCEGYHYPEDAQILKGSCGLEYSLELTQVRPLVQESKPTVSHKTEDGLAILVILLVMIGMAIVAGCLSVAYKTRDSRKAAFTTQGRQYHEPEYQYTPSPYNINRTYVEEQQTTYVEPSPQPREEKVVTSSLYRRTPQPSPSSVVQTTTTTIINPTPVIQQHNTYVNSAPRQETATVTADTHISKSYGGTKGR